MPLHSNTPLLIGITGFKRHGKNTVAEFIEEMDSDFESIAFADNLKRACAAAFGMNDADFFDDALKEQPNALYPEWTNRKILQHVGTELFRSLWPNIWIDGTMRIVDEANANGFGKIITDVRFPNEAAAIMKRGGIIIRVFDPRKGVPDDQHASEAHIMDLPADYDIVNDGSLDLLRENVREIFQP